MSWCKIVIGSPRAEKAFFESMFTNLQKANRTAKEIVRHAATRLGLNAVVDTVRRAKGVPVDHLHDGSTASRFAHIYDNGIWTYGLDGVPGSGTGSALAVTKSLRALLPGLLEEIGCETLIDVGCGDLTWMSAVKLPADYIGIDVVPSVIAANAQKYGGERFFCLDAIADELPDGDTLLCREILFHLSFADIHSLLCNFARKPRRWLIATTDTATWFNADIRSGDYRLLDLCRAPFRFPAADIVIDDSEQIAGRRLGVWRFDRLPQV
jgi:hypothetical protein